MPGAPVPGIITVGVLDLYGISGFIQKIQTGCF